MWVCVQSGTIYQPSVGGLGTLFGWLLLHSMLLTQQIEMCWGEISFQPKKLEILQEIWFLPSRRFNLFQVLNGVSNGGIIQWQVELNYTAGLPKGPRTSFYINYFTKVVYKTLFKRFWQVLFFTNNNKSQLNVSGRNRRSKSSKAPSVFPSLPPSLPWFSPIVSHFTKTLSKLVLTTKPMFPTSTSKPLWITV